MKQTFVDENFGFELDGIFNFENVIIKFFEFSSILSNSIGVSRSTSSTTPFNCNSKELSISPYNVLHCRFLVPGNTQKILTEI